MAEVVNTLEQQHTEYVSRLYVAWATTPQMRNLVKVSSDMRKNWACFVAIRFLQ